MLPRWIQHLKVDQNILKRQFCVYRNSHKQFHQVSVCKPEFCCHVSADKEDEIEEKKRPQAILTSFNVCFN